MHTVRSFSGPKNKDDIIEDPDVSGSERSFSNDGVRHGRDDDSDLDDDDKAFVARPAISGEFVDESRVADLEAKLLAAETARQIAEVTLESRVAIAEMAQKVAEMEREVAERKVTHLRSNSHDANNVLTGVMGFLELALMNVVDEKVRRHLEISLGEMKRVCGLMNRSMDVGGELNINPEPVELNSLMESVLVSAKPFLSEGIDVKFFQTDKLVVNVDVLNIHGVLLNIMKNAAEAMKGSNVNVRPQLLIYFYIDGDKVVIDIIDNGPGIPSSLREKILEDKGVSTKGNKGHGLGLPMAKKIVVAHGGDLVVESTTSDEAEETGTKFSIILPLSKGE